MNVPILCPYDASNRLGSFRIEVDAQNVERGCHQSFCRDLNRNR